MCSNFYDLISSKLCMIVVIFDYDILDSGLIDLDLQTASKGSSNLKLLGFLIQLSPKQNRLYVALGHVFSGKPCTFFNFFIWKGKGCTHW